MTKTLFVILLLTGILIPSTSFPYIYYFIRENKTWADAQTYCKSQYTALATINKVEDLTTIMSTSTWGYKGKAWIGLTATLAWTWEDGEVATYFHWSLYQLQNLNCNDLCVTSQNGFWSCVNCSELKHSICYDGTNVMFGSSMTWINADAYCKSQASSLAKIPNEIINVEISVKLGFNVGLESWIGLRKAQLWKWSDTSENYTFSNWQQGQPDDLNGGQNCAAIVVKNGTWTDEQCSAQYPFFCYDIYKSRSTVVKVTVKSTTNLEHPVSSDDLLQQLYLTFANHGVTDVKLTWQEPPVYQRHEIMTTGDAC